ncbi:MAG: RidA family protein [Burkholderiaceae bacterium]
MNNFTLSNPDGLYDPTQNGFSHLGVVPAGRKLVFVAGQGGETADAQLKPTFEGQLHQAMDNLVVALEAAGAKPADVVKLTVLIVDHDHGKLHALGAAFDRVFGNALKPTCTLIPVPRLAVDGMLFEIEGLAVLQA